MKILLSLYILTSIVAYGQTECKNEVSTDYADPRNNSLPSGTDGNKYLNGFNWFPTLNGIYDDYPCTNISFGGVQYPEMNNIMLNALDDYNYITDGPLPLTENGWELLLVNLGRYPDDVTPITAGNYLYAMPYIVMYNRYAGKIRVFINFGLDHTVGNGADAIQIELLFHQPINGVSGLLRINQGIDQPLDEKSNVTKIMSIAKAPTFGHQWASTDFQISYDPCTCFYPSQLKINLTQITSSTIALQGRSISLENQPLINNTTLQVNPSEFLSGMNSSGLSGGVIMEKSISFLIDDYYKKYKEWNKKMVEVQEHNKIVKENLAILRMAKFIIALAIAQPQLTSTNPLVAEMAAELAQAETLGLSPEAIEEAYEGLGVNDVDWFKVVDNIKKGIVKVNGVGAKFIDDKELFKIVKTILGEKGKTFIANNFETQSLPTAPTTPTATFEEMKYTGTLTTSLILGGPWFYNPGTYGNSVTGSPTLTNVYQYPIYNEVMGSFALLKSPKIKISKAPPSDLTNTLSQKTEKYPSLMYHKLLMQRHQSWSRNYQIQLAEDLKFAINDVLDVKNYSIQASFNIIAKPKDISATHSSILNCFQDPILNVNVTSNNSDVDNYSAIRARNYPFSMYALNFYNLSYNLPYTKVRDSIIYQTPYLPIDAFQPLVSGIGIKTEALSHSDHIIYYEELNSYPHYVIPGTEEIIFTSLDDPRIHKPYTFNSQVSGFEFEFDVELKLIVDIEFNTLNSDGLPNKVTQIYTYPIDSIDITELTSDIVPNLATTNDNIGQYSQNLYFSDLIFQGQQVEGCKLENGVYTCTAWNNIEIDGDILVSSGYEVKMIAGNEIIVSNESTVSPKSELYIQQILDYSHPMPKVDQTYVTNFCKGTSGNAAPYKANQSSKKYLDHDDGSTIQTNDLTSFDFNLFPNPTRESSSILIEGGCSSDVIIQFFDITGKEQEIKIERQDNKFELDVSSLSKGIYLVKVSTLGESKTKQLIIK